METSVTSSNPAVIKGYLKINNTNTYQSYLAGKTLNIKIDVNNLKCESSKKASDIVVRNPQIETLEHMEERNKEITEAGGEVQDDLRRFIGTYEQVTDNFICFGTDDEDTCKNNMDTYMYRIIGVDSQNRLKLIKATKIIKDDESTFTWTSDYSLDIKWNNSDLYQKLNNLDGKNYFVGNDKYNYMNDNTWTKLISPTTYYIGDSQNNTNPLLFVDERKSKFDNGSISLMYISDYLYASSVGVDNWLRIANGLNGTTNTPAEATDPVAENEWTMTRSGGGSGVVLHAWYVHFGGNVSTHQSPQMFAIRPVFYLKGSVNITSGNGDINSPYILDTSLISGEITSPNLETETQLNERNEEITLAGGEVKDDLRRFVGDYTTVTDNFICFGTNDQNDCESNMDTYMYRIIGVDSQNRLKVIKAAKIVKDNASTFAWNYSNSDTKWNESDLYKGLNGIDGKNYFVGNEKYNYMQNTQWVNLISPATYYIGDSTSLDNLTFVNERKEKFNSVNNIGLMYASDYYYADSSSRNETSGNTDNWLFIQNGLNRPANNGNDAIQPSVEYEWTMTRYGYDNRDSSYDTRVVDDLGRVGDWALPGVWAVRPVFYLSSRVRVNGTGTIDNPYYITNVN